MELIVPKVEDFQVSGDGAAPAWQEIAWEQLTPIDGRGRYRSMFKAAYSESGIYVLFDCEDRRLTCTKSEDFDDIYTEDVVEVFLWPDARQVLYFEYEISPLGVELPILVPNRDGVFMGWRPWHYEGERRVRRATTVRGGAKAATADVGGWSAEFFIPFALLRGLGNVPPSGGTRWRGNFYRIDYDEGPPAHWAWSPGVGDHFHTYHEFGHLIFA